MRVTFFKHNKDNHPVVVDTNWDGLGATLSKFSYTKCEPCIGHDCPKKMGKAWSPAEYPEGGKRGNRDVVAMHALVFDLDGCTREATRKLFAKLKAEGLAYILHSTHSHATVDSGHVCLRVVIPLSRPATPEEWPVLWSKAVDYFQAPCDPQCKDLARLYFLPSAPEGAPVVSLKMDGVPLDVDNLVTFSDLKEKLAKSPSPLAKKILNQEPLAVPGERDAQVNRAAGILAGLFAETVDFTEVMELVLPSLQKMPVAPEGLTHWIGAFEEKYNRAAIRQAAEKEQKGKLRASILKPSPASAIRPREEIKGSLLHVKGVPTACDFNLKLILSKDPEWFGRLRYNLLDNREELDGRPLQDSDSTEIMSFLNVHYNFHSRPQGFEQCIDAVARINSFDPLKDYLDGLEWDGVSRINTWLTDYAGVALDGITDAYIRAVGRKWLIGAVARGLEPGSQLDTVLILEGDQGAGKSSLFRALGGPFFAESKLDISSKDGLAFCGRTWIIELAEIDGLTKFEANRVRAFLTTTVDTYRPPYGRKVMDVPRRCAFAGTSNQDEYLQDETGARRFWPVKVGTINIDALRADRDQLWAEATAIFKEQRGTAYLYYLTPEETELHKFETDGRNKGSAKTQLVIKWWLQKGKPAEISPAEVFEGAFKRDLAQVSEKEEGGIGRLLHKAGFQRVRRYENGVRETRYVPNKMLKSLAPLTPKLNVVKEESK